MFQRFLFFIGIFYFLFFFVNSQAFSQTKGGCLSVEELPYLTMSDDSTIYLILQPEYWLIVSQEDNKMQIFDEDTLFFHETIRQYTMGAYFSKLKLYEIEEYAKIVIFEPNNKECFFNNFQQFKNKYSRVKGILSHDSLLTSFVLSDSLTIQFFEENTMEKNSCYIKVFNPKSIKNLIKDVKEKEATDKEKALKEREYLLSIIAISDSLFELKHYDEALLTIDSIDSVRVEFQNVIAEKRECIENAIQQHQIEHLIQEGKQLFDNFQLEASKSSFEQVLSLDSSNSYSIEQINIINNMLFVLSTRDSTTYHYVDFHPEVVNEITQGIEQMLNRYIDEYEKGEIKGIATIKVDTDGENISSSHFQQFQLTSDTSDWLLGEFTHLITTLLYSSSVLPAQKEKILVNAETNIPIELWWNSDVLKFKIASKELKKTKTIFERVPMLDSLLASYETPIGSYKMKTKNKKFNSLSFADISLSKYSYVGPEAMLYSMLLPGAGTMAATQGKKGIGTMSTFIIFGTGTVISYLQSQKMAAKAQNFSKNSEEYKKYMLNSQLWQLGTSIGIGICGVIYISDIFYALSKGINNYKTSRSLRTKIKEGPIKLQEEPIQITK